MSDELKAANEALVESMVRQLRDRVRELEVQWADENRSAAGFLRRAEKAEARVRELEAERDELRRRIHDACPSPDEGGRIHAGGRVVCGQCHDSEVRHLTNERDEARAEVERLRAQVELERMRLAACGVVALANTPEALKQAREMHPDYRSASCEDVARAVEREMKLREERDALRAQVERLTSAVPGLAESGPYTMADVRAIEAHRGKPYARLRATVEQVERVRSVLASYGAVPVPAHVVLDALEGK